MKSHLANHTLGYSGFFLCLAFLAHAGDVPATNVSTPASAVSSFGQDFLQNVSQPIQRLVEQELQRTVVAHKAKAGSVVVMNTRNGAILAMASTSSPVQDSTGQTPVSFPAVTEASTPGAVIAPFLVAAALEVGEVTPLSPKFDTGPGWLNIGDKRIGHVPPNQKVNVSQAIKTSNHVVFAQLALNLDRKHYAGLLDKAGFGRLPGTGLPGEVAGQLTPYETWHPIDMAQAGSGQNITASLLQLARAYGAIANDGVMLPISAPAEGVPPTLGNPVMSVEVARQLRKMLESVTSPNGTAPLAKINGYRVAGKTSTTSKMVDKVIQKDRVIARFIGMAPAEDPHLVVAVMIDEPTGMQLKGGQVAAPLFARIMACSLRDLGITTTNNKATAANALHVEPNEIHFASDSTRIPSRYNPTLDTYACDVMLSPTRKVVLDGHTDQFGTQEFNQALGQRRADAIAKALIKRGVPEDRITTTSLGEDDPVDARNTSKAHAKNRRVTISLVDSSAAIAATLESVVYFDFDSPQLRDEFHPALERVAKAALDNPGTKLEIAGYSARTTPEDAAKRIALQRARNVLQALTQLGVPADRLSTVTDAKPLLLSNAQPATEAEFAKERHVEIRFVR